MENDVLLGAGKISAEYVREFILGGKSILTAKSLKTDKHFTFKIENCTFKTRHDKIPNSNKTVGLSFDYFVSVLRDGDNHYSYIGIMKMNDKSYSSDYGKYNILTTKNSKVFDDACSYKAFQYIIDHYINNDTPNDNLELWHNGYCSRCGRMLTHPESIKIGIGPICINLIK